MKPFVFISCSHLDKKFAKRLWKKLERYPYPPGMVKDEYKPYDSKYIRPVFIYTDDLSSTSPEYMDELHSTIQSAKYLVVLCSKKSVDSKVVSWEIATFLETHNNDYSKILPVCIDDVRSTIPSILKNRDEIMKRNLPVCSSQSGDDAKDINRICYYRIISFLLKVDFTVLFNRYARYKKQQLRRRIGSLSTALVLILTTAAISIISIKKSEIAAEELFTFEKKIFPYSLVVGYVDNFLRPSIENFKNEYDDFKILILLPKRYQDITEGNRANMLKANILKSASIDTLEELSIQTERPRRLNIYHLVWDVDKGDMPTFVDFATTVSAFKKIVDRKMENEFYSKDNTSDDLIDEYSNEFAKCTKDYLKGDSLYVKFIVTENSDIPVSEF